MLYAIDDRYILTGGPLRGNYTLSPTDKEWLTKPETSLRGNYTGEYVTNGIWSRSQKRTALARLLNELDNPKYGVAKDSYRTSFHVHDIGEGCFRK